MASAHCQRAIQERSLTARPGLEQSEPEGKVEARDACCQPPEPDTADGAELPAHEAPAAGAQGERGGCCAAATGAGAGCCEYCWVWRRCIACLCAMTMGYCCASAMPTAPDGAPRQGTKSVAAARVQCSRHARACCSIASRASLPSSSTDDPPRAPPSPRRPQLVTTRPPCSRGACRSDGGAPAEPQPSMPPPLAHTARFTRPPE